MRVYMSSSGRKGLAAGGGGGKRRKKKKKAVKCGVLWVGGEGGGVGGGGGGERDREKDRQTEREIECIRVSVCVVHSQESFSSGGKQVGREVELI